MAILACAIAAPALHTRFLHPLCEKRLLAPPRGTEWGQVHIAWRQVCHASRCIFSNEMKVRLFAILLSIGVVSCCYSLYMVWHRFIDLDYIYIIDK
jgi:hypothetical protein